MKAVIYYADCPRVSRKFTRENIYPDLIKGLRNNLNTHGVQLIHITLNGHEGYGDVNIYHDGDPDWVNYNRELYFADFLKKHAEENETYWFTEPDARLYQMFPDLEDTDADFTSREGRISPAWRLAKKSAYPIFQQAVDLFEDRTQWTGDSRVWRIIYEQMGKPPENTSTDYLNLRVGIRKYKHYNTTSSPWSRQWKAGHKNRLLDNE